MIYTHPVPSRMQKERASPLDLAKLRDVLRGAWPECPRYP